MKLYIMNEITIEVSDLKQLKTRLSCFKKLVEVDDNTVAVNISIVGKCEVKRNLTHYFTGEFIEYKNGKWICEVINDVLLEVKNTVRISFLAYNN